MRRVPEGVLVFIFAILFSLTCNFIMHWLAEIVSKRSAAMITFVLFIAGWLLGVGAIATGSARGGWMLLRAYVGFMGALFVVTLPLALFPHPALIVAGAVAAFAWLTFCFTGKAEWLHRD